VELKAEDFKVRGKLIENAPLAPYTWFRVGGPADLLFLPADEDDLCDFLKALPEDVPVMFWAWVRTLSSAMVVLRAWSFA